MSEPTIADREGGRTVQWAESITEYHPHGLADIENVLLFNDRVNSRQLQHGARLRFWATCWSELSIALWAAPVAAPVVFTSGRWWGTTREYSAWWAYPTAAVVCWIGIVVLGIFYLRWRRERGRFRNAAATAITVVYVVSTVLALMASYRLAGTFDGSIGWYVTPMWIFLLLSILSVVYMVRCPESPAWDSLMTRGKKRLPVGRIPEDDRAWLLEERGRAIRVLAERGLLEGGTPEELAARPLGELHLPTPEVR